MHAADPHRAALHSLTPPVLVVYNGCAYTSHILRADT